MANESRAPGAGASPFGASNYIFTVLAAGAAVALYFFRGEAALVKGLIDGVELILLMVPRFVLALLMVGFIIMLVPRDAVSRLVGDDSGFRGILLATFAGAITPGGPLMAWPIVIALYQQGATRGPLVAYVTSWSVLNIQRIIIWELPLMGEEFVIVRLAGALLMPVLVGMLAAKLPIDVSDIGRKSEGRR